MRNRLVACLVVISGSLTASTAVLHAQDVPFTVSAFEAAPPEQVSAPIKETLSNQAYRVLDAKGEPYIEIWLRKDIPASARPAGPQGAILLPFLEVGECLGAIKFLAEGYDYRDQPIVEDVYTIRYGLQPVNGDHLGVSTFRDYGMLVMAEDDKALANPTQDRLDEVSSEAAASNHPAVFIIMEAPADKQPPAVVRDETADRWGVVLPLSLSVKADGQPAPATQPVQLIILGHGPI